MLFARVADNNAVTIVTNVKVKANVRHSILYLSLHDLLGKPLPLPFSLHLTLSRAAQ
jgi:hypothetical protein